MKLHYVMHSLHDLVEDIHLHGHEGSNYRFRVHHVYITCISDISCMLGHMSECVCVCVLVM